MLGHFGALVKDHSELTLFKKYQMTAKAPSELLIKQNNFYIVTS